MCYHADFGRSSQPVDISRDSQNLGALSWGVSVPYKRAPLYVGYVGQTVSTAVKVDPRVSALKVTQRHRN